MLVGFDDRADLTPCALLQAIADALRTDPDRLGPLVGLPAGCPRAHVVGATLDRAHVGLGVYRYDADDCWGYFIASTLPVRRLRETIVEQSAGFLLRGVDAHRTVQRGQWLVGESEGVQVSVCRSEYRQEDAEFVAQAEQLALHVATATLVAELTDPTAGPATDASA